jgi:hypothetical protein
MPWVMRVSLKCDDSVLTTVQLIIIIIIIIIIIAINYEIGNEKWIELKIQTIAEFIGGADARWVWWGWWWRKVSRRWIKPRSRNVLRSSHLGLVGRVDADIWNHWFVLHPPCLRLSVDVGERVGGCVGEWFWWTNGWELDGWAGGWARERVYECVGDRVSE